MSDAWSWRYHDAAGGEVAAPGTDAGGFPTQAEAEAFLGETWSDLLEEGVDAVTLVEGDRVVYGPMSLHGE